MWPFKKESVITRTVRQFTKRSGFASSLADHIRSDWSTVSISADQLIAKNLKTLRARSRDQYYNNDYAKRFITMVKVNTVGENGVAVQSKVKDMRGNPDKAAQSAIEMKFKEWSTDPNYCDYKRRMNLKEIEDLAMATLAMDGEAFVQFCADGPHGLTLKFIDPEQIDVNYFEKLGSGNFIRFGIEYDQSDRVVAYHVNQQRGGVSPLGADYEAINRTRVPAKDMRHIYLNEFADQHRGIPWMAPVLTHLKMLAGFEEASLVNARISASKMGFFTSKTGDEYVGEEVDGDYTTTAEAGMFEQIPEGLDFKAFDPSYPSGEFQVFCKQILRGIASGLGVSYNVLANDLEGVNFSAMRHGVVEERELWKTIQAVLINQLVKPVFEEWLKRQHGLKTIEILSSSGQSKPLRQPYEYYKSARYQGRRWSWVDPLKEMQTNREANALNTLSISEIIRDRGKDPEEVFEEIAKDKELLKSLGLGPLDAGLSDPSEEENAKPQK